MKKFIKYIITQIRSDFAEATKGIGRDFANFLIVLLTFFLTYLLMLFFAELSKKYPNNEFLHTIWIVKEQGFDIPFLIVFFCFYLFMYLIINVVLLFVDSYLIYNKITNNYIFRTEKDDKKILMAVICIAISVSLVAYHFYLLKKYFKQKFYAKDKIKT